MKISQKGFIIPLSITFFTLLIICGGMFFYKNITVEAPIINDEVVVPITVSTTTLSTTCTCPADYVQEGDSCNPKCYYSNPKCLMPSVQCTNNLSVATPSCPQYMPPAPGFCTGGNIIAGGVDTDGCRLPPKCETLNTKINQKVIINGLTIIPLKVTEDSRCPADVRCVWAGTVRLDTQIDNTTTSLKLDVSSTILDKEITLTKVSPAKTTEVIAQSDYSFEFSVK